MPEASPSTSSDNPMLKNPPPRPSRLEAVVTPHAILLLDNKREERYAKKINC